jgi:hypothetical protein
MLAFSSTSSSFFNQFKLARECGHWENLLNETKQEAKPDIEYISSLNKKMNSLGCSKVMSWRKTNQNFMSYVERKEGCNHFGGEEPYDKARAEEIKKAVEKLKCSSLDSEMISFKSNTRVVDFATACL